MGMSIPYELTGRTHQKARTRSALVSAARELLAEGVTATVEQAADRAAVSRTTAYRYFPNQRTLLLATFPELEASSLLDADAPDDPVARVVLAVDRFLERTIEHEAVGRAHLRLALDPAGPAEELPFRKGRAIGWFEDALEPLREEVGEAGLRRLALAIRTAAGIEALVWLTDVAGLDRDEAREVMLWSARTLTESAIAPGRH